MAIIVTGSLSFDQIINFPGKFSSYILPEKIHSINISLTTDSHKKMFGGTGGNQSYSLSLLGINPLLVATAGYDFQPYKKFLQRKKINIANVHVLKDVLTALGTVITDKSDNQIWAFSKGAMKFARNVPITPVLEQMKKEEDQTFVVIAPNDTEAMSNYIDECIIMNVEYAFDPAFYIPTMRKASLEKGVKNARIVFGNDYEIAVLKKKIGVSTEAFKSVKGQFLITTYAEKGSLAISSDPSGKIIQKERIRAAHVEKPVDPTGAGDAYRAGFLAGYLTGKDMKTCGQMGSVAAAYAVENYGTMEHSYSLNEFWKRYKENYK